MACADTSFLADLTRKDPRAWKRFGEIRNSGERLSATIVNIAEMYRGAFGHARAQEKLEQVDDILRLFVVLDFSLAAAQLYGQAGAALRARGQTVADRDLFTAAIALAHGETRIVTRDDKDFERIPGIEVVSY